MRRLGGYMGMGMEDGRGQGMEMGARVDSHPTRRAPTRACAAPTITLILTLTLTITLTLIPHTWACAAPTITLLYL